MTKQVQKKRKILVQVGVASALSVLLGIMLAMTVLMGIARQGYTGYLGAMMRPVQNTFTFRMEENLPCMTWFMDYWQEHPEEVSREEGDQWEDSPYNVMDDLLSMVGDDINVSGNSYHQIDAYVERHLHSFSPEFQARLARFYYARVVYALSAELNNSDCPELICVDLRPENYGFVYFHLRAQVNSDILSVSKAGLGERWTPAVSGEDLEELRAPQPAEDGDQVVSYPGTIDDQEGENSAFRVGMATVDGNARGSCLLAAEYEVTGFGEVLRRNLPALAAVSVTAQVLLVGLMLLLIYRVVLRPLRVISEGTQEYTQTKDSDAAVATLGQVRTGNELGLLADDISALTVEIDRYTDEVSRMTRDRERIVAELGVASRIQESNLPNRFPAFPERQDFDIFASMTPAKQVGGDFYDFFLVDENRLALVMADVSGKGVPAAMFMMMTKTILHNLVYLNTVEFENASYSEIGLSARWQEIDPAMVLNWANEQLVEANQEEMFVTVWLGILDLKTGRLTAANAGHEKPFLQQPGGAFKVVEDKHGFVLGGMEGVKYRSYQLELKPGAKLFLYTDGLTEATRNGDELFGMDRVEKTLNEATQDSPRELLEHVSRRVEEFVAGAEAFDDLTMLCVEYRGPQDAGKAEA